MEPLCGLGLMLLPWFTFRGRVTAGEESHSALAQKTRAKTSLGPTTLLFQRGWHQHNMDHYQNQHPLQLKARGTEEGQSETLPGGAGRKILINEVSNLKHSTRSYQTAITDAAGRDERHLEQRTSPRTSAPGAVTP